VRECVEFSIALAISRHTYQGAITMRVVLAAAFFVSLLAVAGDATAQTPPKKEKLGPTVSSKCTDLPPGKRDECVRKERDKLGIGSEKSQEDKTPKGKK
jgi:hypothetical protein